MSLTRERILELHAIISDCYRFGDQISRHTIIDIEEALMDLLTLQESPEGSGRADGHSDLKGLLVSFRSANGDSPSH